MERLLLESSLRAFALGAAVWMALKALRIQDPHTQLRAWTVVLVAALAMPLVVQWASMPVSVPMAIGPDSGGLLLAFPAPALSAEVLSSNTRWDWIPAFRLTYLGVCGFLLTRLLAGLWVAGRLRRHALPVFPGVRSCNALHAPVTCGSTVLLPQEWLRWDDWKRRAVLAHEYSHVERGDFWMLLAADVYRALFWLNPFAWWLQRRLAELAEEVADHAALAEVEDRARYAEVLLSFAGVSQQARPTISMARAATLGTRVDRILSTFSSSPAPGMPRQLAVAVILVTMVGACSLLRAAPYTSQDVPPPPAAPAPPQTPGDVPAVPAPPPPPPSSRRGNLSLHVQNDRVEFERGGKRFLITDADTIARIKELSARNGLRAAQAQLQTHSREFSGQMETLRRQMTELRERFQRQETQQTAAETMQQQAELMKKLAELQLQKAEQQVRAAENGVRAAEQALAGELKARDTHGNLDELIQLLDEAVQTGNAKPRP